MKSSKEKVIEILRKYIPEDVVINDSTNIGELNIDSFNFIRFIVEVEAELNIEVADDKLNMSEFHDLSELFEFIDSLVAEGSA